MCMSYGFHGKFDKSSHFPENDISAIVEHLSLFWANMYCECAKTTICEVSEKVLTSPLDSTTPGFLYGTDWRIGGHLPAFLATCSLRMCKNCCFLSCQSKF